MIYHLIFSLLMIHSLLSEEMIFLVRVFKQNSADPLIPQKEHNVNSNLPSNPHIPGIPISITRIETINTQRQNPAK